MEGKSKLIRILISSFIFAAALFLPDALTKTLLMAAACVLSGFDVLWGALKGIFSGSLLDERFLMSVAAGGAFALGNGSEGAAVMILYQLGEYFQDQAEEKSRSSISALMALRPDSARVERRGETLELPPAEVEIGEMIIVLPGERIPLDGTVTEGSSALDMSALTGESLPKTVSAGESVFSGALNQSGVLKIRTDKLYGESTAARILELAEHAEERKAKTESLITRFARIYTPAVCAAALLLFLIPSLITGDWASWGSRALNLLVISCPCALVVSVPLCYFGAMGLASQRGILIKGGGTIEVLAKAGIAAFDKTGTLTEGHFSVQAVHAVKLPKAELLCLAARAEAASNHPIAKSILQADGHGHSAEELSDVREFSGKGLCARVDGSTVTAGNAALMESIGIKPLQPEEEGGSVIHVARDNHYLGYIVVSDAPKPAAAEAIRSLKQIGIRKTLLLSGDREENVAKVAAELKVDTYQAQLMPEDKLRIVEEELAAKASGESLLFVGDGMNDAPVLTRSDAGIAMGLLGSDAAMEAADAVLMNDDPLKLAEAVLICRKAVRITRQNIVFALSAKALILLLSILGFAPLWLAVFSDVGVCLLAVANSLRTLRYHEAEK